jgi:signal transduction histidine kinase
VTSLTVRARVAMSTAIVALVVLVATGVVVYRELDRTLSAQAVEQARSDAQRLAGLVDTGGGEQNGTAVALTDSELVTRLAQPGRATVVLDGQGNVIQTSRPRPPLPRAFGQTCLDAGRASAVTAGRALACARVGPASLARGAIVSGASLADRDQTLATMRRVIAVAVAIASMLVLVFAWIATRRALRPLAQIAHTAREIGAGAVHRRIGYSGPKDEVGALAEELDRGYERLEAAFSGQARFLADVSHELRTPLAASRAHVHLLQGWAAEDAAARDEALAALHRSITRMTRLVDDLLHVAHGKEGPAYAHAPVMLEDLLIEVHHEACSLAQDVDVSLRIDDCPLVTGDRDKLYQLIRNIVDNALRHTPPGGGVVLRLSAAGATAMIRITDTGPGIPAVDLPRIFERRFQRGSASTKGGAGLGLSIANQIARAHGGTISAASAPGQGTTITLTLPLAVVQAPSESLHS